TGIEYQEPLSYEKVILTSQVDLSVLAKRANQSLSDLMDLNPELNHSVTPPVAQYELRVPSGTSQPYMTAFNSLDPSERYKARIHVVKRGDTLSRISRA